MSRNNLKVAVQEELYQFLIEEQERREEYLSAQRYFEEDSTNA